MRITRRRFNQGVASTIAAAGLASGVPEATSAASYRGPNVIIVRFGGGVRRKETIEPQSSYAPFFLNVLGARGVLIPNVTIDALKDVDTSHAEGTLNILTGRYSAYSKVGNQGLAPLLSPQEPMLFEYLRKRFDIPAYQTLLINGEDRPQEEYLTYGGHEHYGVAYRSEVIGLYRYKLYRLQRVLAGAKLPEDELEAARKELETLKSYDYRGTAQNQSPEITRFWEGWRDHYGDDPFRFPRGDQLLTQLAIRAMRELQPRLMMINYQDPDYVHWGNASHYTRAITVIDQGLQQLTTAAEADPHYRDRTVFVIIPDCGRDANPLMSVPFQHHFNSRSAHEIFALIWGPGIARDRVLDKAVDQTSIAATVGAIMGFETRAEGRPLSEIFT